jgi:hypothetical protein
MEFSFACWNVYHFVSELVEEGGMCEWVVLFCIFLTCTWCVGMGDSNSVLEQDIDTV